MLTLFSIPKAFNGQFAVAQHNAIQSWLRLHANVEVVLFGDDEGIAQVCKEYGLRHEGGIAVWPSGTHAPLYEEIFERVEIVAKHRLLCFVCADIILTSDLIKAVHMASHLDRFLLTGHRYDLPIAELLHFDEPGWEMRLRAHTTQPNWAAGIDYCVYPKGVWPRVPPFIMGRPYPDNWQIYRSRQLGVPVIDGTECILAVHQSHPIHGRGHTPDEIAWNWKLAGVGVSFNMDDATHTITEAGLQPRLHSWHSLMRAVDTALLLRSPRLYRKLTLADYRRTGFFRYITLAPWRITLRAVKLVMKRFGEKSQ